MLDVSLEVVQHRPSEETGPVTTTVDHADIRGLGTTLLVSVGMPRSRREDLSQPHNAHEGCTHHRGCVSSEDRCRSLSRLLRGRGLRSGNRPHEGCEFARDGGGNGVRVLAARAQLAISPTEADLRPPGDVANRGREMLLARLDLLRDLGAMTIGLRGFDQNAARMAVA